MQQRIRDDYRRATVDEEIQSSKSDEQMLNNEYQSRHTGFQEGNKERRVNSRKGRSKIGEKKKKVLLPTTD